MNLTATLFSTILLSFISFITLDQSACASAPVDDPKMITPAGPPDQVEYYQDCFLKTAYPYILGNNEEVLQHDKEIPIHTQLLPGWDLLTFEATLRHRHFYVSSAYFVLSEKFNTVPVKQRRYLEMAIRCLEPYFTYIQGAPQIDQLPAEIRDRIIFFRQDIYTVRACLISSLYELAKPHEETQFCKEAIRVNRESISYIDMVASIDSPLKLAAKEKARAEKFNLLQLYCNYARLLRSEGPLQDARQLRDELKALDSGLYAKAHELVKKTSESLLNSRKLAEKAKTAQRRLGPKTKQLLAEKATKTKIDERKKEDQISKEIGQMQVIKSFSKVMENIYTGIAHLDFSKPYVWEEVSAKLNEIETKIYTEQGLEGPLDTEGLERIYACLVGLLPDDMWLKSLPKWIASLTEVNQLEGAIERLWIIRKIQETKFGNATRLTRMYYAYVQTLNGEYDDWLNFENELSEEQQRKEAELAAKQASAKERYLEELKAAQAASVSKPVAKNVTSQKSVSMKVPFKDDKGKEEVTPFDGGPVVDLKTQKQEQLKRHMENEQRRQAQQNNPGLVPVPAAVPLNTPKVEMQEVDLPKDISLIDLYGLTGVARDVELKILQNDWNITKDEVAAYFEAMGCIYKPGGRGSHSKVKLNGSLHIEKDGEIVTLLVQAGGALTLPVWEQGYMKGYLKKQILAAREKLKSKAIETQADF